MIDELREKIYEIIAHKGGVEPEDINRDTFFEDDLNLGEMDLLDIITEIEEIFEIEVDTGDEQVDNVGDLIDIIAEIVE